MKNRITEWRKRRYMTMEKLADAIGTDASTINKLEKGKLRLSDKWMVPIATALDVQPGDLIGESTIPHFEDPSAARIVPRQLPVYGLAAGSLAGHTVMMPDPVEFISCPPALQSVRDAYALIVKGHSMEPRYFPGDILFLHPHRPVRPGDHVVVQVRNGNDQVETATWVKRFKAESGQDIVCEQYNPSAEMHFRRKYVAAMHRVLTVNELFGA